MCKKALLPGHWRCHPFVVACTASMHFFWLTHAAKGLCRPDSCLIVILCMLGPHSPSDLTLQVLYVEGVAAGSRAAVTLGNTSICEEPSICIWYWHSQPTRDQPYKPRTSRVQGLQGPWTEISRMTQICLTNAPQTCEL